MFFENNKEDYTKKPPKCYLDTEEECVNWILSVFSANDIKLFKEKYEDKEKQKTKSKYKSLDCSIMDVSDEIAYRVHDFEDCVSLGLISVKEWCENVNDKIDRDWAKSVNFDPIKTRNELFGSKSMPYNSASRKRGSGAIVSSLISSVICYKNSDFENDILKFNIILCEKSNTFRKALQDVIEVKVIRSPSVETLEYRGMHTVAKIFEAIASEPEKLLSEFYRKTYRDSKDDCLRIISDYISGMTDEFATKMFERLYIPRHGTVFDRI